MTDQQDEGDLDGNEEQSSQQQNDSHCNHHNGPDGQKQALGAVWGTGGDRGGGIGLYMYMCTYRRCSLVLREYSTLCTLSFNYEASAYEVSASLFVADFVIKASKETASGPRTRLARDSNIFVDYT